jgi:hypothetical protein
VYTYVHDFSSETDIRAKTGVSTTNNKLSRLDVDRLFADPVSPSTTSWQNKNQQIKSNKKSCLVVFFGHSFLTKLWQMEWKKAFVVFYGFGIKVFGTLSESLERISQPFIVEMEFRQNFGKIVFFREIDYRKLDRCCDFKNIFVKKMAGFFTQNKAKLSKNFIITLAFEKNANFFAGNCRKSPKIVIITSTPAFGDN